LEEDCTNIQVEYEAFLFGLATLQPLGVKHIEIFGDSLLVVQQVSKVCQCYNGSLNVYLDKCFKIISYFDEFVIRHIPREENGRANGLAKQASDYAVVKYFHIRKLMRVNAELQVLDEPVRTVDTASLTAQTGLTDVSAESSNFQLQELV